MLSICIVSYNTKTLLKNCLHSILKNSKEVEYEIIVVDNNSQDGSAKMVRECFPQIKLITNKENKGYAQAVNQSLELAQGKFIVILNSDTVILPQSFNKTIGFMRNHKDAGIVGCRLLNPDGTLQRSCRSFPSLLNFLSENLYLHDIFPRSRIFGRPFMSYFDYNENREVDVVLGAFMMLRRTTIEQIGLMDHQFFMYAEETDWCYRANQAGWKVNFYPEAEIIHLGGQSTKQNSIPMFIEAHKSHHKFIRKYHGRVYLLMVKLVLVIGILLRILLFSLATILKSFGLNISSHPKDDLFRYWETLKWYCGFKR